MILKPGHDPLWVPGPQDYPPKPPPIDADGTMSIMDPWQIDWHSDRSRLKVALKGRQGGFSFDESWDEVRECAEAPSIPWIQMSKGERQVKELMEKNQRHIEAFDAAIEFFDGQPFLEEEIYCESIAEKVTVLTVVFRNGSRIIGLPANPDTARGFTGNVFLDEFAFHSDPRKIMAALIPIITRGYKLRIVSTPNGKAGKYYEMWTNLQSGYSKHRVDIHEMAARSITREIDVEALRLAMDDDELFAQEFECVFLDESTAFIPYELISQAESDLCSLDTPLGQLSDNSFAGADIGRRKDQTVIWVVEKDGMGRRVTRRVDVLKNMPFDQQERICSEIASVVGRFAIDETGLGMMLAENLERRHGSKIIPVTFTMAEKEDLAVRFKRGLEDRTFLLPSANFIRASLHSIKRLSGTGSHFRFDADRSEETGHADAFWAGALCERASTMPAIHVAYRSVLTRPLSRFLRGREKAHPDPMRPDPGRYHQQNRNARDRTRGF